MTSELPAEVADYLGANHVLSLATASPDGTPHATTLTYAHDGPTVYVWMRPDTLTASHLDTNARVAFTIDTYADDWRGSRGVQATAEARQVLDPVERRRATALFATKFEGLDTSAANHLACFKLVCSQVHFIRAAARDDGARTLGTAYARELVFSVFRELPVADVAELTATLETTTFKDGEVIVRQGAPADKFFIIVSGGVEVVREDDGTDRVVGTLRAGQFFGEIAILRDSPRTATVRAKGRAEVLGMHRDTFRDLVARSLGTTVRLDEIIDERLTGLRG